MSNQPPNDLLLAIWNYLSGQGFHRTAKCLKEEAELAENVGTNSALLEERWKAAEQLQSRVEELELLLSAKQAHSKLPRSVSSSKVNEKQLSHSRLRVEAECTGHKDAVTAVALHATEPVLASGSADFFVRLFDYELNSRLALLRGHTQPVNCVAWAGDTLVSGSADMTLRVWQGVHKGAERDFTDFSCFHTLIGHEHAVSAILNLPNSGLTISCSRDTTLRLWDRTTGACRRTLRAHREWVRCIDANEQHIASSGNDKRLFVFDLSKVVQHEAADASPVNDFEVHENYVEAVKLRKAEAAANDHVAFTAARDKTVRMWSYLRGQLLGTFSGHENWVLSLATLEDGSFVLSAGEDRTLRIWSTRNGTQAYTEADAHKGFIYCVDYRSTDRLLATGGGDRSVRLWRVLSNVGREDSIE